MQRFAMNALVRYVSLTAAMALPLAACNQTSSQGEPSANVASAGFRMPDGGGCGGEVDRYRAVMNNDLAMGHVNKSVYDRVAREIEQAAAACSAGRERDAERMLQATKSRHGYS